MTRAIVSQSAHKWRFGLALAVAAGIHLAAISFATTLHVEPKTASGFSAEPPEISFEPADPIVEPRSVPSDPLPTPPVIDQSFIEDAATPPPIRSQATKFRPLVTMRSNTAPGPLSLSSAKVLALIAPRPEYPYEAKRQRITGDGIALMRVDPGNGKVIDVTMAVSTGSSFLDNAALAGFRRWRFKPGSVSSVICPVTFTLTGASY